MITFWQLNRTRSLCRGRQAAPYVSSRDWTNGLLPNPHVHSCQRSGTVLIVQESRYIGRGWKRSRFNDEEDRKVGSTGASGTGEDGADWKGSSEAGTGASKAHTVKVIHPAIISSK
jgi:hypothetical protein